MTITTRSLTKKTRAGLDYGAAPMSIESIEKRSLKKTNSQNKNKSGAALSFSSPPIVASKDPFQVLSPNRQKYYTPAPNKKSTPSARNSLLSPESIQDKENVGMVLDKSSIKKGTPSARISLLSNKSMQGKQNVDGLLDDSSIGTFDIDSLGSPDGSDSPMKVYASFQSPFRGVANKNQRNISGTFLPRNNVKSSWRSPHLGGMVIVRRHSDEKVDLHGDTMPIKQLDAELAELMPLMERDDWY